MSDTAILESNRFFVRVLPISRPLNWLAAGWRDFCRTPGVGLLHGFAAAFFGGMLMLARDNAWWMAGAFSGFLLMAPLLATGLYAVSRFLEHGQRVNVATVRRVWNSRDPRLVSFGLLLSLAGTGWVATSAAFILTFTPTPLHDFEDFVRALVLAPEGHVFETWLALGGLLAAPVFASTAITIPMLLDTDVSVKTATLTSWRVVIGNPVAMALWATLLLAITLLGMATFMLGLVITVPWLGHASWHAYRDLVEVATTGREA